MKKITILSVAILLCAAGTAEAQNFEYRLKAGFNIGGATPLPLPAEIRKIEGYSPSLSLSIGADVIRHIDARWAIMTGAKFETKGMTTRAQVKNYQITMNIRDGDTQGQVSGVFTGRVKTSVKNSYITVPVAAVYKLSERWGVSAGMFVSCLMEGSFDGKAYDGFIRDGSPVGEKIGVSEASYDFSDDMRRINWGAQIGGNWRAYRHFSVFGDLSWAANSIFREDFNAISFDMHNIYLNVGFAYTF